MSDEPIKVVLDASAITEFCRGSINVGEVLAEVAEEQGAAALPVLCLVEAHARVDADHLDLLINHEATVITAPLPGDWLDLSILHDTVGRLDAAEAVLTAIDAGCAVLTATPALYGGMADGGPVIQV